MAQQDQWELVSSHPSNVTALTGKGNIGLAEACNMPLGWHVLVTQCKLANYSGWYRNCAVQGVYWAVEGSYC
jgi:hypothetical protein